ncbi:MAG: flagellar motor switch protein FliG [Firmicutes bacterium]|nr:flagellar motor switch protein FliG [Bacillota bacterium]MDD4336495.1 flagellar motor switch protein FliG [Bacillota bacterium]MDD4793265.1 flagellar motor switch protein FliG [Bacillota bacterium]
MSVASGFARGIRKAAIVLVSLDSETAASVLKHMKDDDIEQLTLEIATLGKVTPTQQEDTLEEFYQLALAQEYIAQGGIDYAKQILEKALGTAKAMDIINRLSASLRVTPFAFARNVSPEQLTGFIEGEHPQTIALVVAHLRPDQAALVMSALPPDLQADVALRVAQMEGARPEVIKEVEEVLERKLTTFGTQEFQAAGGIKSLVEVLQNVDRSTEKAILERLEEENPEIAEEVKNLMFVFEDIVFMEDRYVQMIIREIDSNDLALALKAASDEVKDKIMRNMSERASTMLQEELEYLGPVRLRQVEEAQMKIVAIIRKMEEAGQVVAIREKGDEMIV